MKPGFFILVLSLVACSTAPVPKKEAAIGADALWVPREILAERPIRDLEDPAEMDRSHDIRELLALDPPKPDPVRASLQLSFSLAVGATWYGLAQQVNSRDWIYESTWASQRQKYRNLDGFRFDDNSLGLNTPGHPLSGGIHYAIGRTNHLGFGASLLGNFVASAIVWEALIEHREVMSLNDLIVTTAGGVPMGEAWFQMGQYIRSRQPTTANRVLRWVFGFPTELNDLFNGERTYTYDTHQVEPDLSVFTNLRRSGARGEESRLGETELGFEANINRRQLELGVGGAWEGVATRTHLLADVWFGEGSRNGYRFRGQTSLFGYQFMSSRELAESGVVTFAGVYTGYRHEEHDFRADRDRFGIVHLPGPGVDLTFRLGTAQVNAQINLAPDFAQMTSLGLDPWERTEGLDGVQGVLAREKYYFAFGGSGWWNLMTQIGWVRIRSAGHYHRSRGIRGRDQEEELIERFLTAYDSHFSHRISTMVQVPSTYMEVGLASTYRRRFGQVRDDSPDLDPAMRLFSEASLGAEARYRF